MLEPHQQTAGREAEGRGSRGRLQTGGADETNRPLSLQVWSSLLTACHPGLSSARLSADGP